MMTKTCPQSAVIDLVNGAHRKGLTKDQEALIQQAVACLEHQYLVQKVEVDPIH